MIPIETLPLAQDPRWSKILLMDSSPKFRHLTTQLLFSRVKMTLKVDPSPPALLAAATTVRNYFATNQTKVPEDLASLIQELEKLHG